MATDVARQLVGDPELEIDLISANTWTVNDTYATQMSKGRVFIMGDAAHRHPPSNGLGSNTSIQDAFNLCWKMAAVVKGEAGESLLDSYTAERAPVAKQIVTRANQSISEFGPIFETLGMTGGTSLEEIRSSVAARCETTPEAEQQRAAIRAAIAFKEYAFDAHGVDVNQRYKSDAVVTDGQMEPAFELDAELHYQPTTWPGARLPHVWVFDPETGEKHSTLDLCGKGAFTLLTGIGGEAWEEAAKAVGAEFGLPLTVRLIGPRRKFADHTGDWARASEITGSGWSLVRPDDHVCGRAEEMAAVPEGDLRRIAASCAAMHRIAEIRRTQVSGRMDNHERRVGNHWVVDLQGQTFKTHVAADPEGATVTFEEDGAAIRVTSDWTPGDLLAQVETDGAPLVLKVDKITQGFRVRSRGAELKVHVRRPRQAELAALMPEKLPPDTSKMLLCPMPGLVVKIDVEVGQEVQEGQPLCTIEAMKMENILRAEKQSMVSKINAAAGDSLAVDDVIIEFE